jgi:ribosomal-protein-serine acetyltransferase
MISELHVMDEDGFEKRSDLNNDLVSIRPFQASDAFPLYEATRESIDQLCAWMVWCHPDYSLKESQSFIAKAAVDWARGDQYSFGIFDWVNGTFLGSVGLRTVDRFHRTANLGYWVRSNSTNRGVASAATRLVTQFAFQELCLNRIEILIPTENLPSQLVAKKAGAQLEGVLRNRLILHGRPCDAVMMSLVANDLERKSANVGDD